VSVTFGPEEEDGEDLLEEHAAAVEAATAVARHNATGLRMLI